MNVNSILPVSFKSATKNLTHTKNATILQIQHDSFKKQNSQISFTGLKEKDKNEIKKRKNLKRFNEKFKYKRSIIFAWASNICSYG